MSEIFTDSDNQFLKESLDHKVDLLLPGTVLKGIIAAHIGNDVIVEVGLKSEGIVEASEFDEDDQIEIGRNIDVFLEEIDAEGGVILLSKRKADRIKGWENVISTAKEGDTVKGKVTRRIKGGLLGRYRRTRVPSRITGRYPQARRYQPFHRYGNRVQNPQDRHRRPQHRCLSPQTHRRRTLLQQRKTACRN